VSEPAIMTNATTCALAPELLEPKQAYDLAADYYDSWIWQEFWRNNEFKVVIDMLCNFKGVTSTLDVGAGTGFYLKKLEERNKFAVGVDLSVRMLQWARARLGPGVPLTVGDITALPFSKEHFDLVLCTRVLSHVREIGLAFAEIARVLGKAGRLLISDLDIQHDYVETHLPAGDRKLRVRTYKRSTGEVLEAARQDGGFAIEAVHKFNAQNVVLGVAGPKLGELEPTGTRTIGYVALLSHPSPKAA